MVTFNNQPKGHSCPLSPHCQLFSTGIHTIAFGNLITSQRHCSQSLFVMTVFTGGFGEAALNKVEPSTIEKEVPYEYADSKVHNMQGNQRGG